MNSNSLGKVVIISSNGTREILGEAELRRATDNYCNRGHMPLGGVVNKWGGFDNEFGVITLVGFFRK